MVKPERIVIKVGTNSITLHGKINEDAIYKISYAIKALYSEHKKPVLVSSGAVAAGMELSGVDKRPKNTKEGIKQLQYLSAIGARPLQNLYASVFEDVGMYIPYIPATWHSFATKEERENIVEMVNMAWDKKDAIIFNTNDALTNRELVEVKETPSGFYDNDPLAVEVAKCINADLLIFITDKGNMGTGGEESKTKAIKDAEKHGIRVKVGNLSILSGLETLLL